ncbi:hypothetical protein V2J09_004110 [Rumex salicifolius]
MAEEEEGLLVKVNYNDSNNSSSVEVEEIRWRAVEEELKKVGCIAAPMVAVLLSQFMLQVISTAMVGHLGQLSLSSSAIALSLASVTGFSFLVGMASGLETLSGQSYGAARFRKVGTQTYTAILALTLVCIPISLVWSNTGRLLVLVGQDPLIAYKAGDFMTYLIPALFACAALQPLVRYFQCQSLITPMFLSSVATLCAHIPLCWLLVFRTRLATLGAAVAMAVSMWLNVLFLALYMRFSAECDKTRSTPCSFDVLYGVGEFFRFAVPSAVMICLEWWSFELLILLSGLLPNPALETSVLSICLTTISTLYAIPYGVGAAASTRVSNELGAGNAGGTRTAAFAVMMIAFLEGMVVSATLFALRNVYGYSFSSDKEVVDYVSEMAPFLAISVTVDSLQGVLSGIARGCGWQHIGAFVNLGAFYMFGIPIAAILGFWMKMRGKGLWLGILAGAVVQTIMLSVVTARINWRKQVLQARRRVLQGDSGDESIMDGDV